MLINQTLIFVFLIVISLISEFPTQTHAYKCWNGLGKCGESCGADAKKVDYHCEESKTCCVPNKIVIPVKSIDNATDNTPGDIKCGLSHGTCEIKCMPPTTVYRGSYNECPQRHFCCIKNSKTKNSKTDS